VILGTSQASLPKGHNVWIGEKHKIIDVPFIPKNQEFFNITPTIGYAHCFYQDKHNFF
jgi:hypothetical protein